MVGRVDPEINCPQCEKTWIWEKRVWTPAYDQKR